jgi:glycosyltransferase involved in cell wall biosynthesis
MKIFMKNYNINYNGPHNFMSRIQKQFGRMPNIELTHNEYNNHDIAFHLVEPNPPTNKINISRMDGVYHHYDFFGDPNRSIKDGLRKCQAVVYQSEFSKKLCEAFIGEFDGPTTIINNGADKIYFDSIPAEEKKHKYNFICSASWNSHKRLKEIINAFLNAGLDDSVLFVAGENYHLALDKKTYPDNIVFTGKLDESKLISLYKICDACIHISRFDSCPNSVVESLLCNCPVITNNITGTTELVEKCGGIICKIDDEYDYKYVDLYNPPAIDINIVSQAIVESVNNKIIIDSTPLLINNVADKYLSFFEEVRNYYNAEI